MTDEGLPMCYDRPIASPEHGETCCKEGERRYGCTLIIDGYNMLLVTDKSGSERTDQVLQPLWIQSDC